MGRLGLRRAGRAGRAGAAVAVLTGAAAVVLLIVNVAPARSQTGVPVLVVDGRGFGHGVGLAQDGALSMGRAGASTARIIGQFYPGTSLAHDANAGQATPEVRVAVFDSGPIGPGASTVVAFPDGGELRDALSGQQSPGFPIRVGRGGSVRLAWDGSRYTAEAGSGAQVSTAAVAVAPAGPPAVAPAGPAPGPLPPVTLPPPTTEPLPPAPTTTTAPRPVTTTTTTAPAPSAPPQPNGSAPAPTSASSARPLWAVPTRFGQPGEGTTEVAASQRLYRGVIEATGEQGALRLINQLGVEDYLKGMGEVLNPSWPPAALQAQAIAARTYALRAMQSGGELCDDQRCQVYLGAAVEYPAMSSAVDASRGVVVAAGGALADTVYSANGGGFSASREEGFGLDDAGFSYLRPAPYLTFDPAPWETRIALRDVAARLSVPGTLTQVAVLARGPSGRAVSVAVTGDHGTVTVSGLSTANALGLRSTLFSVRVQLDSAAPPPPGVGTLQQSPDALTSPAGPVGLSAPARPTTPVGTASSAALLGAREASRRVAAWALLGSLLLAAVIRSVVKSSRETRPRERRRA